MGRVLTLEQAAEERRRLRAAGRTLAVANGHFDLVHVGHLRYLVAAREAADELLVAINSDASVARLKGAGRPLVPASERAELLAGFAVVSYVVVFGGDTPAPLLLELQPEFHCKGTDYGSPERVPEFDAVRSYGGQTLLVGDPKDHSTRDLIARARALDGFESP
jgi:rfaE bifunctional protein nucleotidyltransferase chain/domain